MRSTLHLVSCSCIAFTLATGLAPADAQPVGRVRGTIECSVPDGGATFVAPLPELRLFHRDAELGTTSAAGAFDFPVDSTGTSIELKLSYDGPIAGPPAGVATRLQVMDEGHGTRSDTITRTGTIAGDVLDLGTFQHQAGDCELWLIGREILMDFHQARGTSPPAGELRLKRWSGVVVGTAHAFYDYLVLRTDFVGSGSTRDSRRRTLYHEFGHSIRHVADGDMTHWNNDNARWIYGRDHSGNEITNLAYAFNEGWANYWRQARYLGRAASGTAVPPGNRDWNERLVGDTLLGFSNQPGVGDSLMVQVLENNAGGIHSLHDFEVALAAARGLPAPPAPASCPPDFTDDGATCRRVHTVTKPSQGRGGGLVPTECGPGRHLDAGLCYPVCNPGFHPVGPVCWGTCPPGYDDHGATCYRGASIIGADNSDCPWYDKCGLVTAKGCSRCPPGYSNDGCTCRIDVHVTAKPSYGRGGGSVPNACTPPKQMDAGLCYDPCPAGMHGVGPVCWGNCPPGYDDHGGTCHQGIILK